LAIKDTLEDEGAATDLDGAALGTGIARIIAQREDKFSSGRVLDSQRNGAS